MVDVDLTDESSRPLRRITERDGGDGEPATELDPQRQVGRYVIQSFLAQGGMGVVYIATDPELGRRVALKLVRARGDGNQSSRQRLLREAQALAQLSHPNVIAVYDVGLHDDRVFIAMELIDGVSLRKWLEQPRHWRTKLEVLIASGRGLAAAHAAGIVHRDFKPDNVVVSADGRVCVLDFGLARSVEIEVSETRPAAAIVTDSAADNPSAAIAPLGVDAAAASPGTAVSPGAARSSSGRSLGGSRSRLDLALTQLGTVLGTPAYMSPEHHRGEIVTAASDQFSFCVTAWEALYQRRPFASEGDLAAAKESHRVVIPSRGSGVPARVRRLLLRGLAPAPAARFGSMSQLLTGLTWALSAPRRWAFTAAGLVAVLGVATALMWHTTPAQRCTVAHGAARLREIWNPDIAARLAQTFRSQPRAHVADSLIRVTESVGRYSAEWTAMYVDSCVATHERRDQSAALLDLRTHCLEQRREALRALLAVLVGSGQGEVIDHAVEATLQLPAIAECADVTALRAVVPLPADPRTRAAIATAQSALEDIRALVATGQYVNGLPGARNVVAAARSLSYPPLLAEALHLQTSLEDDLGQLEQASTTARDSALAAGAARDDAMMVRALIDMMWLLGHQARYDEALALAIPIEAILARAAERPGLRALLLGAVGRLLTNQGKLAQSVKTLGQAVALRETEVGVDDWRLASSLNSLGEALRAMGRNAEARPHFVRALQITERALGPMHPNVAAILNNLGAVLEAEHHYDEAQTMYERSLAVDEQTFGSQHARVAVSLLNLGSLYDTRGDADKARTYLERSLAIQRQVVGAQHPDVAMVLHNLGTVAMNHGDRVGALARFREALAIFEQTLTPDHPNLALPLMGIGEAMIGDRRPGEAVAYFERALTIQENALGRDANDLNFALEGLGRAYLMSRRPAAAITTGERLLALYAKHGGEPASIAAAGFQLARALWIGHGDRGRAVALARQARSTLLTSKDATTGPSAADPGLVTVRTIDAWLAGRREVR
jgi:eukaryotic-like serine/threonine-protein kinase